MGLERTLVQQGSAEHKSVASRWTIMLVFDVDMWEARTFKTGEISVSNVKLSAAMAACM
jgi:hypothetical protein